MNIHSIEAEQAVLGACLKSQSAVELTTEKLTPDCFFNVNNRNIFQAITDLVAMGTSVDIISIAEKLNQISGNAQMPYLYELANASTGDSNARAYISIIKDKSDRRALGALLGSTIDALLDPSQHTEKVISSLAAQLGASQGVDKVNIRTTNEIMSSTLTRVKNRLDSDGKISGLPTGLTALDDRFLGLDNGDLIIVAGRPSMGKSVLAWQISINTIMANKTVLFFSLEMTADQLMERAIANQGHVHLGILKNPKEATEDDWARINMAGAKIKDKPLIVDETPGLHINQVCARARAKHRINPLSLVVVDHIHLMNADGQSREREMAHISGALKGLAKELNCPVIAVAQLNRGVEQRPCKRPMMSDLRDSGSIEQDADKIMLMYREDYYDKDSINQGVVEVITGKYREGETGTDYLQGFLHQSRLADQIPDFQPALPKPESKGFKY